MTAMTRAAALRYRLTTPGRPVVRAPEPEVVLGIVESLPRDGHVVLQSMDEPEVYIQVWLRPDGSYQIELRDGSVHTHVQTRSVSRERVAAAFTSWLEEHSRDGDAGWRDDFQWNDISRTLSNP
jgi:hypothetical protein